MLLFKQDQFEADRDGRSTLVKTFHCLTFKYVFSAHRLPSLPTSHRVWYGKVIVVKWLSSDEMNFYGEIMFGEFMDSFLCDPTYKILMRA